MLTSAPRRRRSLAVLVCQRTLSAAATDPGACCLACPSFPRGYARGGEFLCRARLSLPCARGSISSNLQNSPRTLWPSGQGVGLLSRWGLPAWVRIPQVSHVDKRPKTAPEPRRLGMPKNAFLLRRRTPERVASRAQAFRGAMPGLANFSAAQGFRCHVRVEADLPIFKTHQGHFGRVAKASAC